MIYIAILFHLLGIVALIFISGFFAVAALFPNNYKAQLCRYNSLTLFRIHTAVIAILSGFIAATLIIDVVDKLVTL